MQFFGFIALEWMLEIKAKISNTDNLMTGFGGRVTVNSKPGSGNSGTKQDIRDDGEHGTIGTVWDVVLGRDTGWLMVAVPHCGAST
jgi:hypothetical protein